MANQINVFDLHRLALVRRQKERDSFISVLEKCYSRIKRVNNIYRSQCDFDVPIMVAGRPLFDMETCIKFMIRNLTSNGFVVDFHPPRTLHISWGLHSRQSPPPIANASASAPALLPPPPPTHASPSVPSHLLQYSSTISSDPLSTICNPRVKARKDRASAKIAKNLATDHQSKLYEDDSGGHVSVSKEQREEKATSLGSDIAATTEKKKDMLYAGGRDSEKKETIHERYLSLPIATRSKDINDVNGGCVFFGRRPNSSRSKDAADSSDTGEMARVMEKLQQERKRQDDENKKLVPRPKSQAQFYRSISEYRPSGRFPVLHPVQGASEV